MPGVDEGVVILIILGMLGFWIWIVVDCATKETDEGQQRLIWILVVVLGGLLGALAYLIARRSRRKKLLGR